MYRIAIVIFCCLFALAHAGEIPVMPGDRTMKTLIVYYSLTDRTHAVAQVLAAALHADMRRVEDVEKPSVSLWFYITAGFAAMRGKEWEIKPIETGFQGYDRIIVGAPVWGGSPASPINTLISRADFSGKEVILFMTMGGNDASGALRKMAERIKKKGGTVVSSFALSSGKASNEELAAKTRGLARRFR